jgi:stringent starvation protein B
LRVNLMSVPLPPKKEVALALLERSSVHVHLDPRAPGVVVPAWFKKQPQLVLQVGLNMPVPIPDLRLDEEGMSCTLSFNRTPFFCVVPWPGVYAMVGDDGRGMVWPDDVPPEVASQARGRESEAAGPKGAPAKRSDRPPTALEARSRDGAAARKGGAGGSGGPRPAIAAVPAPSKAKKPRKRGRADGHGAEPDTRTRAGLVAVPSVGSKKAHEPAPPTPKAPPADSSPPNTRAIQAERRPRAAPRPKRELPPYLRVVK